jgi:hypothetical protein
MSARVPLVDVEEIQTTRSEKLLAVVLGVFLLIGGVWTYDELDEWARSAVSPSISAADRIAVERLLGAQAREARAVVAESTALSALELAREAYRTALDADRPSAALRLEYVASRRAYAGAQADARGASAAVAAARPEATDASKRIADEEQRASDREALLGLGLRLAFVIALLVAAFWLLARLRGADSRWLPLAFSAVGFATVLAFVMAGDYTTDYFDPLHLGPLVLSLVGIVLTLLGFAVLQRYLARRIPTRRVRKGECPFCGYPVGQGDHCEGCGREVVAACTTCASPRRVGTFHCRACGAA